MMIRYLIIVASSWKSYIFFWWVQTADSAFIFNLYCRYRPRFFDQVAHGFSGNEDFFTKQCHHQTYQNYEQSRQKLGLFLENKVLKNFKKKFNKSWSPSSIFFKDSFFLERFDQFLTLKNVFENPNFEIFEEVFHNFGKSDGDIIQ